MLRTVLTRSLSDRLRPTLVYMAGVTAVTAMYVSVFPSMQDQMAGYTESLPEWMRVFIGDDFGSPAGYIGSSIFTILGPVLLVAAAVTYGADGIAGEEENRTLPLLLSVPLARTRVAVEKILAVTIGLTAIAGVLFVMLVAFVAAWSIDASAARLGAATLHLHALAMFAAALAFGVGASTGRRALAIGVGSGAVVAGFMMDGLAATLQSLSWLRRLSPFAWYDGAEAMQSGIGWGGLGLLYGSAVVVAVAGILWFDRRDLT